MKNIILPMLPSHCLFGNRPFLTDGKYVSALQWSTKNPYRSSDLNPSIWGIDLTVTWEVLSTYR